MREHLATLDRRIALSYRSKTAALRRRGRIAYGILVFTASDTTFRQTQSDAVSQASRIKNVIVACCSARKASPPSVSLSSIARRSDDLAEDWLAALDASPSQLPADQLYRGRAFQRLKRAATERQSDLLVLSAGVGPVTSDTPLPSYSASANDGPDGIVRIAPNYGLTNWWRALCDGPYAVDLTERLTGRRVFIALSASYARMVAEDLERLESRCELRLFGAGLERHLPTALHKQLLPYEENVVGLELGTRGDFAARALAYHLDHVAHASLEAERTAVANLMRHKREVTQRARISDAQILGSIAGAGEKAKTPGQMLSLLRSAGMACSGARMNRLWLIQRNEFAI